MRVTSLFWAHEPGVVTSANVRVGLESQASVAVGVVNTGVAGHSIVEGSGRLELKPQRTTGVLALASTVHNQKRELVMEGVQRYLIRKRAS